MKATLVSAKAKKVYKIELQVDGHRGAAERNCRLSRDGPTSRTRRRRVNRGSHGRVCSCSAPRGRGKEQEEEEGEREEEEEEGQVSRRRQRHRHERKRRHNTEIVTEKESSGGCRGGGERSGEEDAKENLVDIETSFDF
jgi:hypothetical protein